MRGEIHSFYLKQYFANVFKRANDKMWNACLASSDKNLSIEVQNQMGIHIF